MKFEPPHDSPEENEAQITALLLGELPPEQVEALRLAISRDENLRQLHARLKLTIALVRETVASPERDAAQPAAPKLSGLRREKLLGQFKTITPKELGFRDWARSWLAPAAVAAGFVALLGVGVWLAGERKTPVNVAAIPGDSARVEFRLNTAQLLDRVASAVLPPSRQTELPRRGASALSSVEEPKVPLLLTLPAASFKGAPKDSSLGIGREENQGSTAEQPRESEAEATLMAREERDKTAPATKLETAAVAAPANNVSQPASPAIANDAYFAFSADAKSVAASPSSTAAPAPGAPAQTTLTLGDAAYATKPLAGRVVTIEAQDSKVRMRGVARSKTTEFPTKEEELKGGETGSVSGAHGAAYGNQEAALDQEAKPNEKAPSLGDTPILGNLFQRRLPPSDVSSAAGLRKNDVGGMAPTVSAPAVPTAAADRLAEVGQAEAKNRFGGQPRGEPPGVKKDVVSAEARPLGSTGNTAPLALLTMQVAPEVLTQTMTSVSSADWGVTAQASIGKGMMAGGMGGGGLPLPPMNTASGSVASVSGALTNIADGTQGAVSNFFSNLGVDLSPPKALYYNAREGTLQAYASAQDVDTIQRTARALNFAAPETMSANPSISSRLADTAKRLPSPLDKRSVDDNGILPPAKPNVAQSNEPAAPQRPRPADASIPQPEVQTTENAFSTFSLNVSDVSFRLAAASLEKGVLPDVASVRSEEFINAFDYRDPEPAPGVPIAFAWERSAYPFAQNRDLLRFSLKTAAQGRQAGRALNIVLLLDNSGSMERADRVQIIREALRILAAQLQSQDKLSIVTFARTAQLRVDGAPGSQGAEAVAKVSELTPQGGTNLEEAMNLAYQTALRHYLTNGVNRVVLLTDGAANLGNLDPEALQQQVEIHRKQGVALDCFGIGWEGYNDDLLEVLSRHGDGRYGFVNSPEEAATGFASQVAGALQVAASDVKVQVEFNPDRVKAYRQVGYAKHQLTKEQFRDNTVNAAQIAAAESGNALYVIEVDPAGRGPLARVRVRYRTPGTSDYHEHEWEAPFSGNAAPLEQGSPAIRLAATASAFSEWLAVSPFAGEVNGARLLGYLRGVPEVYGADARPRKLEWMIRQAQSLSGKGF